MKDLKEMAEEIHEQCCYGASVSDIVGILEKQQSPQAEQATASCLSGLLVTRDYFAAQAMNAIIIGNSADTSAIGIGTARDAYAVADAMIKAREESAN